MNSDKQTGGDRQFSRFIFISIAFHVGVVLVFTVKAAFFPSEDIIIQSAVRVDMVALPDKMDPQQPPAPPKKDPPKEVEKPKPKPEPKPKPLPKPKPKPVVKTKPAPKDKTDLNKLKEEQQKALEKLAAMEALEKLKKEQEDKEKEIEQAAQVRKGNFLSKGSSLSGLDKIQFDEYLDQIQAIVKNNWDLPQWLADANLKAQAVVVIDSRGLIVRRSIISSSSNDIFDSKVLEAIDKSAPFPPPPSRLEAAIGTQGIGFNFP